MLEIFQFPQIIGYVAGFMTSITFMPQAVKSIKTQHTQDLSLTSCVIHTGSCYAWLTYGWFLQDGPLIFWNSVTLLVALTVLMTKRKYG